MNASSLIEQAACDGVEFRLGTDGAVRLRGPSAAVARWTDPLRELKAAVSAEMAKRVTPTEDQEEELRRLTQTVYGSADEAQLGFALGLIDIESALICYRALADQSREVQG